jgi:hypothetical protein
MNVALLAALAVALTGPALAGHALLEVAGASIQLARAQGAEDKAQWVDRLIAARRAVEKARRDEAASKSSYGRMRSRGKLRGEKRRTVTEERDRAHLARIDAERQLELLLEKARRERVPPGWVREALDGFEPSPASIN